MVYGDVVTRLCGLETIDVPAEREVCDRLARVLGRLVEVGVGGVEAERALEAYRARVAERRVISDV